MIPTVIFDIDGTLADCDHRRHFVEKHPKNWTGFFSQMSFDPPKRDIITLHRMVEKSGISIVYCTGRGEEYRQQTQDWLNTHVCNGATGWPLLMRPSNDSRPDQIVKTEMWKSLESQNRKILFMVDDRDSVVNQARALGYTVLQCAPGDFNPVTHYTPSEGECLLALMVGPSGAGKSSHIIQHKVALYKNHDVVSSDQVREWMTGDFKDQSKNSEVFSYINDRVLMNHGIKTIIDATHLKRKDRLASVALAPKGSTVLYVVVDRPLSEKKVSGGWRLSVMFPDGSDLVEKHHQTFQSQQRDIMKGDGLPNVIVCDYRTTINGA